jgi:hypothetical protein
MADFNAGDIITFHLRDNLYGVAKILHVENLALHDNIHLAIYDRIVEGKEGTADIYGDIRERDHDFDGELGGPPLISHLALTAEAFADSSPLKVGEADVDESELAGYQVWLHSRYERAVKQGMIREREEEEVEEVEEVWEVEEDGEVEEVEEVEEVGEVEDVGEVEESEGGGAEGAAEAKGAWAVLTLEDVPIGQWLFQQHDSMHDAELLRESEVGKFVLSHFDESNTEEIEELVGRFVDGDYAAGHELLDFGAAAANALARELDRTDSPELADDILRILGDMGNDTAYEHIASYLGRHPKI